MVVGCVSGKWLVIDSESREFYTQHTDGSEPIQVNHQMTLLKFKLCLNVVPFLCKCWNLHCGEFLRPQRRFFNDN